MKKYLVLHPFRSYGIHYAKGTIVDEDKIRSPYLRLSEGKIVLAVASAEIPASDNECIVDVGTLKEDDDDIISTDPQLLDTDEDAVDDTDDEDAVDDVDDEQKIETKKPLFSFGGK